MGNSGKLWGTALGLLIGGPIGGAIGLGIGHMYDEDNTEGFKVECPHCKTILILPQHGYYECSNCHKSFTYGDVDYTEEEYYYIISLTINLITRLFEIDGRINGEEKLAIDEFFRHGLELSGEDLNEARKIFKRLKKDKTHFTQIAKELTTIITDREYIKYILTILITFAYADRFLNEKEVDMILNVASIFGFNQKELNKIFSEILAEDNRFSIIILLIKLCKVDGKINKQEINFVNNNYFTGKDLKDSIKIFNLLEDDNTSYIEIAEIFSTRIENDQFKIDWILFLFQIAIADAPLNKKEENMISDIARVFGFSNNEYSQIKDNFFFDINKCYTILECKETDSLDTIKQKYRQLIRQYHPDKITSKDMAKDIVDFAESRFRDIQEAYDIIIRNRQEK